MNVQNSNPVGFGNLKELIERAGRHLSKDEKMLERQRGRMAGFDAKIRANVDECKEIIIRETLAGNFEYLKGFNEMIGKDLAKKAYASIAK